MKDRLISPEGSEFLPGTRFAESLVEIPISLPFMDCVMMVYFSSTFSEL